MFNRLFIESDREGFTFKLSSAESLFVERKSEIGRERSDDFLLFIEEFLDKHKIDRLGISDIVLIDKQSSITGSRIVNAAVLGLSAALNAKVSFQLHTVD